MMQDIFGKEFFDNEKQIIDPDVIDDSNAFKEALISNFSQNTQE